MPQSHQDWVNTAATSKESSLTSGVGGAFMQLNNKKISGSDNDCMSDTETETQWPEKQSKGSNLEGSEGEGCHVTSKGKPED